MSSLLLSHLIREQAAIGEFLDLLEQEAQAMSEGDFVRLSSLSEHKSQLTDQIAQLDRLREAEQLALGYAADRSGADAAAAAGNPALRHAWSGLLDHAAQAHERNHRNGVLIHTHLDFTRQAINFLQARGQPLYGPDGVHQTGSASGNSLGLG